MQSTNSEYGSPYLARRHFTFTFSSNKCSFGEHKTLLQKHIKTLTNPKLLKFVENENYFMKNVTI